MCTLLLVVAGLALIGFVAVSFILPRMAGSDAKEAEKALIAGAESAKGPVAAAAEKAGNLTGAGNGVKIEAKKDAKAGDLKYVVEANGVIRGWNEKNAIEVLLTPALQGVKVGWACRGYPNAAMPANCGGK
ncbi:MAG: hypothetical protein FJY43_00110 [Betaproteobacteria bacterium]|nr:hypothetical protein [Betaproteobacteria bacterium]